MRLGCLKGVVRASAVPRLAHLRGGPGRGRCTNKGGADRGGVAQARVHKRLGGATGPTLVDEELCSLANAILPSGLTWKKHSGVQLVQNKLKY
jgi:hypothetical protein